jgi:prepilin-type N-terminal cleavage/methylation domain-containing protein
VTDAGSPRRRGLTLIELVIVMALAALVLGMGLGSIASLDLGARSAVGTVQGALRSANNWAVARRAPARVRIDAAARTLTAAGQDVIGTWHFEKDPPPGAFELDGDLIGAVLIDDGFLGRAVTFRGLGAGARFQAPVHESPSFDLRDGFQVQMALRPEEVSSGKVLQLGDTLGIEVGRGLDLVAWFSTVRLDESGATIAGGKARARTEPGALEVDRWNRVLVSYDRSALILMVEGLAVARVEDEGEVAPIDGPLVLGGGQRPWAGSLDSLVISAVTTEEKVELPETMSFAPGTPKEIVFAAGGGLDRRVHREPVRFALELLDGEQAPIQINLYGTVE